jgi:hypothetical protein
MRATRKSEVITVDGTPDKRMYWSIISDYNLKMALCELVDNALDRWTLTKKKSSVGINVELDADRQLISVKDNAGGLRQAELRLLVAPGGSKNNPNDEVIGIFGVGGKRAGIALGEHVEIRTRYQKERSYQLDITKDWLESEDWRIGGYEIPDIEPGTTQVDVSRLRRPFSEEDIREMHTHLAETYSWFLREGCTIRLNGKLITPIDFDVWAFPPEFPPHQAKVKFALGNDGEISAEITGGLIRDRIPEEENYGVYIYCNHRLIVKELKTRDVGYFVSTEAGVPHPDASLCRAIVRLQGSAKLMPWSSNKSSISSHPAFQKIRPTLIQLVSHFTKLSRRLKDDWPNSVFRFSKGTIEQIEVGEMNVAKSLNLPQLPRGNKSHIEQLKLRNKSQLRDQPWTLGIVEAMAAVDIITRQKLETRNRIALILLDSNFEIALKEFIVHETRLFPASQYNAAKIQQLFRHRPDVIAEVSQKIKIPPPMLTKVRHYYDLRNKLIHERATVDITDTDVSNYRETIEELLGILFQLRLEA